MVTLNDSLVSSALRILPLRMRPDLTSRYHRYQGRPYWVVKEPIGLKYYRFQEEEYSILRMLDGTRSFQDIKEEFEREFAPQKITLSDLQNFIGMLHRSGLLIADAPGQGIQLKLRRDQNVRRQWLERLSNILALRFKGIDPDRILNFLDPWFGWLFSLPALGVALALALSALALIGIHFDTFRGALPGFHEFFGPRNWFWLAVVLGVTKILHEFGHGLSCKHFGGECHEMGVMFLVLTPCLYCNVSDSWLLPNKWHRATIGAAGMYVEMWLASIATFVWWFSEPGLLNHLALNVMFVCSVSTLVFNGNPLLRFDGYYILSDLIEIPNLRQKSSKILHQLMQKHCLGMEVQDDPFLPQRGHLLFGLYTVAAVIYRWVVVFSIFLFLNNVLEPYGLKILGQIFALGGVIGLFVQPIWQLFRFFKVPGRLHEVKSKNALITLTAVGLIVAGICFVPLPYRVKCSLEVAPRDAKSIYTIVPGRLHHVAVREYDTVTEGQLLAELRNEDLELQIAALEGQVEQLEQQRASLDVAAKTNAELAAQIPSVEKSLLAAQELLAKNRDEYARLRLVAPAAGTVLPAPDRPAKPESDMDEGLPTWSGSPLDQRNLNCTLMPSDPLCSIGDPQRLEVVLIIDQTVIDFVDEDRPVWIKLDAYPEITFESTVAEIAKTSVRATPTSLSNQAGGDLATKTDPTGVQRPLSASFQAKAHLPDTGHEFRLGMRGRGKIAADWQPLGTRILRFLAQTFHFRI